MLKVKVQFVKEEIIEIPDAYEVMVEDCRKALLGESTMPEEEWNKWVQHLEAEVIDKIPFDHAKMYLAGVYNLDNEPLAEFQKGVITMNNNKVFETDKIYTQHLGLALKPKDKTDKCRVAKVGAGVVILPDNGSPISAKEIVKALGLKNVEPEAEKVEKIKIILENNYDCGCNYYLSLTDSQMKLIEFLGREGLLEDWECRNMGKMEFEEI